MSYNHNHQKVFEVSLNTKAWSAYHIIHKAPLTATSPVLYPGFLLRRELCNNKQRLKVVTYSCNELRLNVCNLRYKYGSKECQNELLIPCLICFQCHKWMITFFSIFPWSKTSLTQPAFTCSKLTMETLEQGVKYV